METRSVATVFGGSGFLGRYVVKRLAASGHIVRIAVRDTEGAMFLRPMGRVGQIVPMYASLAHEATIGRAVEGADLVVNLIGILAERRAGDFQRVQAEGAGRIARLAAAAGATRMVQISAIGADPAGPSLYAKAKADGEAAVLAAMPSAVVMRPSLVFGAEDQFFNRFAKLAQVLPFMPVIAGATRMQPVYVGDVADAVIAGLTRLDTPGKIYRTGRSARLDVPRNSCLHPPRDEAEAPVDCHPDGHGKGPGVPGRVAAHEAVHARPVAAALEGQRGCSRHAWTGRTRDRRHAGRVDRAGLPGPVSAWRWQA